MGGSIAFTPTGPTTFTYATEAFACDERSEPFSNSSPNPNPDPNPNPSPNPHPHPNPNQVPPTVLEEEKLAERRQQICTQFVAKIDVTEAPELTQALPLPLTPTLTPTLT